MSNRSGRPASARSRRRRSTTPGRSPGLDPLGQPAVAVLRRPADGDRRRAADPDRHRRLHRPGSDRGRAVEPPGAAGQGRVLVVERRPQRGQRRLDVGAPAGEVDAQQGELTLDVPGADAEHRPAGGQAVEGGEGLGHLQRVVVRQGDHVAEQPHRGGDPGQEAERGDRVVPGRPHRLVQRPGDGDVLADPDVQRRPARSAARATSARSSGPAAASHGSTKIVLWAWTGSCRPQATVPSGMMALIGSFLAKGDGACWTSLRSVMEFAPRVT